MPLFIDGMPLHATFHRWHATSCHFSLYVLLLFCFSESALMVRVCNMKGDYERVVVGKCIIRSYEHCPDYEYKSGYIEISDLEFTEGDSQDERYKETDESEMSTDDAHLILKKNAHSQPAGLSFWKRKQIQQKQMVTT
jgi:hypothetical protein